MDGDLCRWVCMWIETCRYVGRWLNYWWIGGCVTWVCENVGDVGLWVGDWRVGGWMCDVWMWVWVGMWVGEWMGCEWLDG